MLNHFIIRIGFLICHLKSCINLCNFGNTNVSIRQICLIPFESDVPFLQHFEIYRTYNCPSITEDVMRSSTVINKPLTNDCY